MDRDKRLFFVAVFLSVIISSIIVLIITTQQKKTPEQILAREVEERAQLQADADKVLSEIRYMKDSRTGLCFAYRWGRISHDGPSLTLAPVPCECISADLITVAK